MKDPTLHFRKATEDDLVEIVAMLADDKLGQKRENFITPLPKSYTEAFARINKDENQELIVALDAQSQIVGTLQLSFIQYLTYQGGIRAQIEAVRIHKEYRGQGLGKLFFNWSIARAQERGAHLLQLTTDKERPEAIQFYERLGFTASHVGMKMHF